MQALPRILKCNQGLRQLQPLRHLQSTQPPSVAQRNSQYQYQSQLQRPLSQPTYFTHPHLLSRSEVTPHITRDEYINRRQQLSAALPANSLSIFPSNPQLYMTEDVPYLYHPNTDLMYICGVAEPSAFLLAHRGCADAETSFTLFVAERDASRELWEGPLCGPSPEVADYFALHDVRPMHDLPTFISSVLPTLESFHFDTAINPSVSNLLSHLDAKHQQAVLSCWRRDAPPKSFLLGLRLEKSTAELVLLRQASTVIANALNAAMSSCRAVGDTGVSERQLDAVLEYECKVAGAERMAFPSVVASGRNATVLHYMQNDAMAREGGFIMVDAGCQVHGYCSDVSRSWPASGRFSGAQRDLYALVLAVQKNCIAHTREAGVVDGDAVTLDRLHMLSARELTDGLLQLGFMKGHSLESALSTGAYAKYFPHAIGHYLGLDVHDTHLLAKNLPLRKGMVVTVEPGVYCPVDDASAPSAFRGIGMRVEDDVVVGDANREAEVLSVAAVKEIDDVEALVGSRPR